ncbi:hypothetical protein [Gordonia rhizosphera]|uniref:Uncharacterized protein n=1 Tax=Gordonia rhizosphera NBRC 16068 TaxID=1108045 RepID=K6WQ36_9ACTN|nr:hypothetical protein [Gordonia rhizosphera]GAB88654.1 hypothetical protein GORHZ_034_00200 [Gordonia rhizosphera NBRC 16068]
MNIHGKSRLLTRAVAATAPATLAVLGVLGMTAPTATALPISNLQSECRQANGQWVVEYSTNSTGIRYVSGYECWYRDINGDQYVDLYDRKGNYQGTG